MRLFIAINFSDEIISSLIRLREELCSRADKGSYSEPENMHLTLSFLGECSDKQAETIKAIMDSVTFEPLSISIDRVGKFGGNANAIWWAGVKESEELLDLQSRLESELKSAGFSLDDRKYNPHITLGRKIAAELEPWPVEPFGETVYSIELMHSKRDNGSLTYEPIHSKQSS